MWTPWQTILDAFNADFRYVRDLQNHGMVEHWRIPTTPAGETVRDDCDGYALGLLFRLSDHDEVNFWNNLQDGTAAVHLVQAVHPNGEVGEWHAVLRWHGKYVDNIYPEVFRDEMIHLDRREFSVTDIKMKLKRSTKGLDSAPKRTGLMLAVIGAIVAAIMALMNG